LAVLRVVPSTVNHEIVIENCSGMLVTAYGSLPLTDYFLSYHVTLAYLSCLIITHLDYLLVSFYVELDQPKVVADVITLVFSTKNEEPSPVYHESLFLGFAATALLLPS